MNAREARTIFGGLIAKLDGPRIVDKFLPTLIAGYILKFGPGRPRLRSGLLVCVLIGSATWVNAQALDEGRPVRLAQQTVTVPPATPGLPSTLPKAQAFTGCVMNCDTGAGMCQGACSVSNSPITTLAHPTAGTRPDPGALTQCYINCTTQQLACKRTCGSPP